MINKRNHTQNGSVIVSILAMTLFLTVIIYALIVLASSNLARARGRIMLLQAQYSAESGSDYAIAQLNGGNNSYTGSGSEVTILENVQYKSTYTVSVAAGADSKERIITATGRVYSPASAPQPRYERSIEVIAQQSGDSTTSSMLSRNIIDIASGVKSIQAVGIRANGYINMAKNTTDLIAETVTVAGKNTGASNCSIGGSGNLVKPSVFTTPGQTKTQITVAYNNCVSPPGNVSNADFDVLANQTNITKAQSTYIPWSAYMDGSYQNSPTGCSDWTSGSFPRSIPSIGNDKKTHYPNDGSGTESTCGSSGNIQLSNDTDDEYIIRNHTHIRASLCASSACTPTFFNPDPADIKYIFVEGTIRFDGLITTAGSGPIVFIAYGSDPTINDITKVCPTGGAIYLGKGINTNAPAAYLLAMNGLCLDKTKFASEFALGGLSGKNIYVSTNSGVPFDLGLDPTFPTDQIPIDLAWRSVQYRRL